jgi:hypothetical protein
MKKFDIDRLDEYYEQGISFKCIDILKWVKSNLSSNEFNIKYAAEDLMSHYFIRSYRRPNNDCYYYIKYNHHSKNLYLLERDYVMSPLEKGQGKNSNTVKEFNSEAINIQTKILKSVLCTEWDRKCIEYLNNVYNRREQYVLGGVPLDFNKYYKLSSKQKNQLYSISKNRLKSVQTLYFIFKKATEV